jgi:hypothetical protein
MLPERQAEQFGEKFAAEKSRRLAKFQPTMARRREPAPVVTTRRREASGGQAPRNNFRNWKTKSRKRGSTIIPA